MTKSDFLGFQQDLFNTIVMYVEPVPSFPPEACSVSTCHIQLSVEDVTTAAAAASAYLGFNEDTLTEEFDLTGLLRAYCLEPEKRLEIIRIVSCSKN